MSYGIPPRDAKRLREEMLIYATRYGIKAATRKYGIARNIARKSVKFFKKFEGK